ncbi:hypothetical protein D3C76_1311280 [compost metagenome]
MKAQEALFFIELALDQVQQLAVGCLVIKRHVEQPVELADLGVFGFRFQLFDVLGGHCQVVVIEQRDGQAQGERFQDRAQGVGFYRIVGDQRRHHGALVLNHIEQ